MKMAHAVWPSEESNHRTIPAAIEELAQRHPDRLFLHDAAGPVAARYTFGDVRDAMHRLGGALRARGVSPGDAVAILAPNGAFLLHCILGVQRCGAAPVVIYPPSASKGADAFREQLLEQVRLAGAKGLVVADEYAALAPAGPSFVALERDLAGAAGEPGPLPDDPRSVAHLQFTSGSTGRQRGVMVTHQNILDNVHALALACEAGPDDRMVSWLPLAHDMGLLCGAFMPLLKGFPLWLTRPAHFIQRPVGWLRAISDFRGTLTFAPNFAYQRCVKSVRPADAEGLDLSSLKVAVCASEPIVRSTLDAFYERFRPHGLRDGTLCPAYGLAENTVAASVSPVGRPARFEAFDYETLVSEQRLVPPTEGSPSVAVCALGRPLAGVEAAIVDEQGRPLPEDRVGEIVLRGRMVALGYRGDPAASAQTFRDGALHTGDYGFLSGGEIFITGRKKDIIIHAGRNYYPQDFEAAALGVEGVAQAAAFGLHSDATATEGIVVLAGTNVAEGPARHALVEACRRAILDGLAVSVDEVVPVPPNSIPKTTSGKVRRAECRRIYLEMKRGKQ